ncbi:MAG: GGDEF domain-containing protein, partial [Planctomycetota bacterium]
PESLGSLRGTHRELVAIVGAANRLCLACGMGQDELIPLDLLHHGLPGGVSMSPEQIDRVLGRVERALEEIAGRYGLEYGDREAWLERFAEANRAAPGPAERGTPDLVSSIAAVSDVLRRARRAQSVPEILDISLQAAQQQLAFDRLLYLQVDLEEELLVGRHFFDDTHIEVDVGEISIPLNPDGLLGMGIQGRTAQRIDNWATDGELLRYLGVVEVAAAPVVVNEQPHGIICGDMFFRNVDVSDADVALLGILATDLSLAIENHVLGRQATKLQALASKDELTGVHNRRSLMSLLQREIDRAQRYGSPLAAVMVDLDRFKDCNDNYGHMVGDEILREVAQVLVANSREIDVIGRYGGDEFLLVLPETDQSRATVYAERVRSSIEQLGREHQRRYPLCELSISIGVTALDAERDSLKTLVHRVDHALLAAKQRGRNRVCLD